MRSQSARIASVASAVRHVEIGKAERTERDAPLDALDRMIGGEDRAVRKPRHVAHEAAVRPEARHAVGRRRIAGQDHAVGRAPAKSRRRQLAGELGIELGEHLGLDRDHDDAGELAVLQRPPPADAEELAGILAYARLQHPADISAGVAILLRQEIAAVGDADRIRDRRNRRRRQHVPVGVGDQR